MSLIKENIIRTIKRLSEEHHIDCSVSQSIAFITDVDVDVKKFVKQFPWGLVSHEDKLDEDFLAFFKEHLSWYTISRVGILSERFIEKYKDKLNWSMLSQHQNLSESFMEKYEDKLDWSKIAIGQTLSEEFIIKHRNKFASKYALRVFQKLSNSFKDNWL